MDWFIALIIIIVVPIIGYVVWYMNNKEKAEKRRVILNEKIKKLPNQQSLKLIEGKMNRYAFIVDNVGRKIFYIDEVKTTDIPFDKIINIEVIENNTILSSKSTSRTVGGALLGGVLAGGAGMVVGGLSGDSKQKKKISEVKVKIKVRDYNTPSIIIPCFIGRELAFEGEVEPTDLTYQGELQNAQKIADYVSVIIDDVDRQEKQTQTSQSLSSEKSSVADELAKLAKLKADGVLTDEEFQIQKAKLLG